MPAMGGKRNFSRVPFTLVMLFFYIPLVILVIFSFNASKSMAWGGFSLRWYAELFFNSRTLWNSCLNSVAIALSSASLSTLIGTLGAIGGLALSVAAWCLCSLALIVVLLSAGRKPASSV